MSTQIAVLAVAEPAREPEAAPARPSLRGFAALLARDLRVLRRGLRSFIIRAVCQPLFFVFVFSFVLPRVGAGAGTKGVAPTGGGPSFATILVPGLVASTIMMQGIMSVSTPLVMELSYTGEIEDRAFAPLPMWHLGLAKVVTGAIQAAIAAIVVFPCVLLVHAHGQEPKVDLGHWPYGLAIVVLSSLFMAGLGLLFGTVVEPRKLSSLFTLVLVPVTMLGCVYYPWVGLHNMKWLQVVVLFNPLVYVSEALRSAFVPSMPHLPTWSFLLVLIPGTAAIAALATRTLTRRLVG